MLMKKLLKMNKETVKLICMLLLTWAVIFVSSCSYAAEFKADFSKEYLEWLESENRSEEEMPRTYSVEIPKAVLYEQEIKDMNLTDLLKNRGTNLLKISSDISTDIVEDDEEIVEDEKDEDLEDKEEDKEEDKDNEEDKKDEEEKEEPKYSYKDSRFSLADVIDVRVKDQMYTSECWAFALMSSLESNNLIREGKTDNYSERHMDYATSKSFTDGTNPFAYNREVGAGGLSGMGLAYLTNGQGAVLESDMPFKNDESKISIKELDKEVKRVVTDYEVLPTILKTKNANGTMTYKDATGKVYTAEEVKEIRDYIKKAIIEHGGIASVTAGTKTEYYNNPDNILTSTAYNCDNNAIIRDHAITIIGWDDNYSKNNFNSAHRPSTDGAYIVLNSYGETSFDKGIIYISYEDILIESDLYVIQKSAAKDYDKIYQTDEFGGVFAIGTTGQDTGYYANVYQRDVSQREALDKVGITVEDYVQVEIYLNPNNSNLSLGGLKLVGSSKDYLEPGYHEIDIQDTELLGKEYAIVVKQYSLTGKFYISIETSCVGTVFSDVKSSNNGRISLDGKNWEKINEMNVPGLEMENSDVCIKGFTKVIKNEVILQSKLYKIDLNKIFKIEYNTSKENFLKNLESTYNMKLYDKDGVDITTSEKEKIIKTGMKLKLDNGNEYLLIVRGDLNCDGMITLTDLSKMILEYNEVSGFRLSGAPLDSADLNCDGKISLTDVSQLLVIYSKIM